MATETIIIEQPRDIKEDILLALGLTPEEFEDFRSQSIERRRKAKDTPKDKPLETVVPFYNDRYRGERVLIGGKRRQFVGGVFVAKTENELAVMRTLGSHVFEGDDLRKPATCKICNRKFMNQAAYESHIDGHVVT